MDPSPKVDPLIGEHRSRPEFPLFYGRWELHKSLAHLPDENEINRTVYDRITRSLERAFKTADDQIRATRRAFGASAAWGVLVLLNENVDTISPGVICHKVGYLINKLKVDGSVRYSECAWVVVVCEAHRLSASRRELIPCLSIEGPSAEKHPDARECIDDFQRRWAEWNNAACIRTPDDEDVDLSCRSRSDTVETSTSGEVKRQESWTRQYHAFPSLRGLSKKDLFEHGRRILAALTAYFLKGEPRASGKALRSLLEEWTHFIEEVNYRGFDMKTMANLEGR